MENNPNPDEIADNVVGCVHTLIGLMRGATSFIIASPDLGCLTIRGLRERLTALVLLQEELIGHKDIWRTVQFQVDPMKQRDVRTSLQKLEAAHAGLHVAFDAVETAMLAIQACANTSRLLASSTEFHYSMDVEGAESADQVPLPDTARGDGDGVVISLAEVAKCRARRESK
jgi:hypothetical protein